jgi:hypothetical protein
MVMGGAKSTPATVPPQVDFEQNGGRPLVAGDCEFRERGGFE